MQTDQNSGVFGQSQRGENLRQEGSLKLRRSTGGGDILGQANFIIRHLLTHLLSIN